ncbi:MAG: hypothetical protein MZU91_09020 [Desulfosudis oleivorans]|nr:hypothetical protein [Desulfosudis oleivorans]
MSHATFSGFMVNLRERPGLVEEGQDEKNRKEKAFRITWKREIRPSGLYSSPATNTIVKTVPEGIYHRAGTILFLSDPA